MSPTNDLVDALAPVVAAFEHVQPAHFIGSSGASSFHEAPRSTMDVDLLLCEMPEDRIATLFTYFFYLP